uniref:Glucokinase n=2 Tax=Rhodosorus marinus TaxID=101924 RepID=A0A7S2ZQH1_9RHOD|mmetsp:Transcript_2837/g.13251  ORF Transcript_2837/g.13251 Transcript_2837/m.13251 type:complete len:470 (+) Transcript_2837:414-1823(+)
MEKDTEEPKTIILMGGDIGGTNSRFALFKVDVSDEIMARGPMDHPPFEIVYAKNYLNADYSMFRDVMTEFFADAEHHSDFARTPDFHLTACCLAVAGPVDDGRANFTNRGWVIDSQDIKEWFGFEHVRVVNDFVASGYGILTLMETEVTVLQEGKYSQSAPIAVLGAGTGLGECFLAPNWSPYGSFYDAYPSEGGHVEFAPKTDIQFKCLQFLSEKFQGRVSVERIVSGKGLLNVYEFFKSEYPDEFNEGHDHKIINAVEAGAVIASLTYDYTLCAQTMEFVFEVYGTEAGSVALKFLPYGGLYIAGSLAPRNIERLTGQDSSFMKAAINKGRVSPALKNVSCRISNTVENIPIKVVMCEDLGMRGSQLLSYRIFLESKPPTIPAQLSSATDVLETTANPDIPAIRKSDGYADGPYKEPHIALTLPARHAMDITFIAEIAVASSIAASIALIIGFGARSLTRIDLAKGS